LKSVSGREIGADPAACAGLKGQEPNVALGRENYDFGVGTMRIQPHECASIYTRLRSRSWLEHQRIDD
jgi:hypothetical protein